MLLCNYFLHQTALHVDVLNKYIYCECGCLGGLGALGGANLFQNSALHLPSQLHHQPNLLPLTASLPSFSLFFSNSCPLPAAPALLRLSSGILEKHLKFRTCQVFRVSHPSSEAAGTAKASEMLLGVRDITYQGSAAPPTRARLPAKNTRATTALLHGKSPRLLTESPWWLPPSHLHAPALRSECGSDWGTAPETRWRPNPAAPQPSLAHLLLSREPAPQLSPLAWALPFALAAHRHPPRIWTTGPFPALDSRRSLTPTSTYIPASRDQSPGAGTGRGGRSPSF